MSLELTAFFRSSILFITLAALALTPMYGQNASTAARSLSSAQSVAAAGSFDGKLYTNEPLGLTMLVPGGWNIYTPDQNAAAFASGRANTLAGTSGLSRPEREGVDRSISNTQILFQAVSRSTEPPTPLARLSCGVEKLISRTKQEDYVKENKRLVLMTSPATITKDVYSTVIGGASFTGFDVEGVAGGKTFRQRYLVTIRHGFAIFLVITLWNDINDSVLDASLKTLKFKRQG